MSDDLAALAERMRRATVAVRNDMTSLGSGVIWQANGLIVTNAHVVNRSHVLIELADGRRFEGAIRARDLEHDLAVVTIEASGLPAATFADSDALRPGELVFAMGHPFGVPGVLTAGVVYAPAVTHNNQWIQADLRLAPGNSGGPLCNAGGYVVGINSMIMFGLALAIPSNRVKRFLTLGGPLYLGVTLRPATVSLLGQRRETLLVLEVASRGPAANAGVLPGDILLGVNDRPLTTPADLRRALGKSKGDSLLLDVGRGGKRIALAVDVSPARRKFEAA